ncbi:hypothetical protein [Salinivibrio sp. YCSC6]|uniref:hypothetical protein n=1 Tax=Salinivibrio sp. YCSC6 TaxID=2003370 RepID=UPI000BBCEB1F|nr:hypothetical protein [Salinivibrio sp. YCSC6]PCE67552.1 hypothetical protein B6G00_04180 [Salinivibrio sp. YCSC6]QCF35541.1 hypothetical protein E8E00_04770 [Salinivibrio sp. YCSC6]
MSQPLRLSITETATLLDMSVQAVREAVYKKRQCGGVAFPRPIIIGASRWQFWLEEVVNFREKLSEASDANKALP